MIKRALTLTAVLALTSLNTHAAGQWYQDVYGATNFNGQVTLNDANGNPVTTTVNPTGGAVSTTASTTVQPPVVVVQATASLPIKAVGDPCTATTSGTSPNQTADEGTAITADRTMLLSCQSGAWTKQGSSAKLTQGNEVDYIGRTTVGFDTNTNPATPCTPSVAYVNCRRITKAAMGSLRVILGNGIYTDSTWCDWQNGNVARCSIGGEIWYVYAMGVAKSGYPVSPWAD